MSDDLTASSLREALAEAIGNDPNSSAVEELMRTLDKKKLFRYHKDEAVNLLSTPGRVLMAIMEDPTLTQRAISVYLGCSETLVDKTVKTLVDAGLITKTKVNRQNVYRINPMLIDGHSDIQHLRQAMKLLDQVVNGQVAARKAQNSPRPRVVSEEPF